MPDTHVLDSWHILALGNSYTIGEGVEREASWPHQLAGSLGENGYPNCKLEIIAKTGWTSADLQEAHARAELRGIYDLVFLQIGVNNQYEMLPIRTYQIEFRELLATAIEFTGGNPDHVIVLSIPDWGVTPHAEGFNPANIATQINRFNELNRLEAEHAGAQYVDVTGLSRKAQTQPDLLAADGLHPSGVMYGTWVEEMMPTVLSGLRE